MHHYCHPTVIASLHRACPCGTTNGLTTETLNETGHTLASLRVSGHLSCCRFSNATGITDIPKSRLYLRARVPKAYDFEATFLNTMHSASVPAVNGAQNMVGLTQEPAQIPSPAPIAIVGLAGRFPGEATNAKNLWDMCCQGRSAWSEMPSDRFNVKAYFHPNPSKSGCVRTISCHT